MDPIKVTIRVDHEALAPNWDGADQAASTERYAALAREVVTALFPTAEVAISIGPATQPVSVLAPAGTDPARCSSVLAQALYAMWVEGGWLVLAPDVAEGQS